MTPEPEAATLELLIDRCAHHDPDGLAQLYDLTSPVIYAYIRRHTATQAAADAVTVCCYLNIWHRADTYNPQQPVLTWLFANVVQHVQRH